MILQSPTAYRLVTDKPSLAILCAGRPAKQEAGAPAWESRLGLILSWSPCQGGRHLNSQKDTPRSEAKTKKQQPGLVQVEGLGSIHARKKQKIPYLCLATQSEP